MLIDVHGSECHPYACQDCHSYACQDCGGYDQFGRVPGVRPRFTGGNAQLGNLTGHHDIQTPLECGRMKRHDESRLIGQSVDEAPSEPGPSSQRLGKCGVGFNGGRFEKTLRCRVGRAVNSHEGRFELRPARQDHTDVPLHEALYVAVGKSRGRVAASRRSGRSSTWFGPV